MMDKKDEKKTQSSLVVRRNDLIEGRYKIRSTIARRILYRALSQIDPGDNRFRPSYTVNVSDVTDIPGIKMHDMYYRRVREAIDLLQSQITGILDPERKKYIAHSWFHKIQYNWGEGTVSMIFHDDMKQVLLNLIKSGNYTAADEKYLVIIRSPYSDRMYGLLKQYQKLGSRVMTVDEIKEKLEIEKMYPVFADFRRYVLDVSKKEIEEKTDISFDYEFIKKGKRIDAIRFNIKRKPPEVTIENREEVNKKTRGIFQKLLKFGIEEKTARGLIADYDDKRLKWHIDEYTKRFKNGTVNSAGWLVKAIREDYRPQGSIFEREEEELRKKLRHERQKKEVLNEELDRIKAKCDEYNRDVRMSIIRGLSDAERANLDNEFKSKYKSFGSMSERLDTEGLENSTVRALYLDLIREKCPDVGMSYKKYAEGQGARKEILDSL